MKFREVTRLRKLVQKVSWNLNSKPEQFFMYGEASVDANQQMQIPLEKLYQYENQSDMYKKIQKYVNDIDKEINRVEQCMINEDNKAYNISLAIVQTLQKVRDDLLRQIHEAL